MALPRINTSPDTSTPFRILPLSDAALLPAPMGVDYVVIGFDMEVQTFVTPTMQLDLYA